MQSTLHLLPGRAEQDRTGPGQARHGIRISSDRRCKSCIRSPPRSRPPRKPAARRSTRPPRSSRTRSGRSRAKSCPTINAIEPSTKELADSFPKLASSFSVLNELFNELAYNPGKQGGFLFFPPGPTTTSTAPVSSADAHGALGCTLAYLNCNVLPSERRRGRSTQRSTCWSACSTRRSKAACQSAAASVERKRSARSGGGRRSLTKRSAQGGASRPAALLPGRPRPREAAVRGGGRVDDAEARAHARQHPRDRPVRAQLLRAAAVPVGVLRRDRCR